MSAILFFDPVCQQPYDTRTLRDAALGGSEASLIRIADALEAYVMQHNRTVPWGRYLPAGALEGIEHVVVNREAGALAQIRQLFPRARVYLWLHDRLAPGSKRARRLATAAPLLRQLAVTIVCVSQWQRSGVAAAVHDLGLGEVLRTLTIYNPVDDALAPDGTPVDDSKLVFFSSPNKGLDFTLDAFEALRRTMPDLRLVVGNPGYKVRRNTRLPGVEFLGALPQAQIHSQVRDALCTFFPNFAIPETFGLVFAESHALGTPVLTLDCGAALEVLGEAREILPLRQAYRVYEAMARPLPAPLRRTAARLAAEAGLFDAFCERLRGWRSGQRPRPQPDARFRLSAVAPQWRSLFAG